METNTIGQQVANLYQTTSKIADSGVSSGTDDKVSFGSLLQSGLETVVETQRKSEEMSKAAVTGSASVTDVVQAVTEAEVVLQTAIAVRDRVITAYKDIMNMPI